MAETQYCGKKLFSVDNILEPKVCQTLIQTSNKKGWNKSSPSGGGHGRTGREDARTNMFCVIHDDVIANTLWERIKSYLPDDLSFIEENVYFNTVTKGSEWNPAFVYNKLRIYKYEVGEAFPEHIDYKVKRQVIQDGVEYVEQSFLSLLIYLNDDFTGGQTGYWPDHNGIHCRFLRDVEKQSTVKDHQVTIQPSVGKCVIQDQNILHEGLPPKTGTKYLLRTDIIHRRKVERPPGVTFDKKGKMKDMIGEWERLFETSCKNYAD